MQRSQLSISLASVMMVDTNRSRLICSWNRFLARDRRSWKRESETTIEDTQRLLLLMDERNSTFLPMHVPLGGAVVYSLYVSSNARTLLRLWMWGLPRIVYNVTKCGRRRAESPDWFRPLGRCTTIGAPAPISNRWLRNGPCCSTVQAREPGPSRTHPIKIVRMNTR